MISSQVGPVLTSGDVHSFEGDRLFRARDLVVIAIVTAALTACSVYLYPVWADDARVELMSRAGEDIAKQHVDRPVMGWFFQAIYSRGQSIPGGIGVHFLSHFSFACLSGLLWRTLFPQLGAWSLSVALLTLTPAISRCQFVLLNIPVPVMAPSALALGACLCAYSARGTSGWRFVLQVCSCVLVFVGTMISEYALPSLVAVGTALILTDIHRTGMRKSTFFRYAPMLVFAAIAYLLYSSIADPAFREAVRPEIALARAARWRLLVTAPRIISMGFQVVFGKFLAGFSDIKLNSLTGVIAAFCGLVSAVLLTLLCRGTAETPMNQGADRPSGFTVLILAIAVLLGLCPIVAMGGMTISSASSRFLVPVMAVAACLLHAVAAVFLRSSFRWVMPAAVGMLCAYQISDEVLNARADLAVIAKLSREIRPRLARNGLTVAIIDCPRDWNRSELVYLQNELVVHIARDWSKQELDKFWIFSDNDYRPEVLPNLHTDKPGMDRVFRTIGRRGPIVRLIWVAVMPDKLELTVQDFANGAKVRSDILRMNHVHNERAVRSWCVVQN